MRNKQTPWGMSDYVEVVGDGGILFYSTPSHGGYWVPKYLLERIPKHYREYAARWSKGYGDQWYEEDCAAVCVVDCFPEYFPGVDTAMVDLLLKRYNLKQSTQQG